ncbi:MAG: hypothetical protein JSU57_00370, partial [Candidatus Heimdallarchaeota archaeon]
MTIQINYEMKKLQLSVRDISFLGIPRVTRTQFTFKSAEIGQEIHQKIQTQKQMENNNYKTEYFVKYQFSIQGWQVIIRGRIDLLARTSESIQIEEIKSIFLKQFSGSPDDPRIKPFRLQLQCYAWILNQIETGQPSLSLQLILFNRFDNKQHIVPVPYQDMSEYLTKKITLLLIAEEEK